MEGNNKAVDRTDITKLSNELTYRQYMMNRGKIKTLFQEVRIPEYIALQNILQNDESESIYGERTYLKELSEKMQLSIRQTSKMIAELRDRGLVLWSHDGTGKDGTYVSITENGKERLKIQEEIIKSYYGRVIEKYGKENLIQLLHLMKQLDTIMCSELEEFEEGGEDDDLN